MMRQQNFHNQPYIIQHNLVQVKNHATSSLKVSTWLANDPSYLSQSSMRGMMARIRKWSWKNDRQWRRWIPIIAFCWFHVPTTRSFPYQAPAWDDGKLKTKWCKRTGIFQLCLRFDSHTTSLRPKYIALTKGKLCPKASVAPTQTPTVAPPSPRIHSNLRKQNAKAQVTAVQFSGLRCVDWISVSSKSPKSQNLSPSTSFVQMNDARRARAWYVDCRLLAAVPWALAVHGPLHLNCGTGMAGQEYKGHQRTGPSCHCGVANFILSTTACPCFWFSQTCFKTRTWPCILLTTQIPTTTRMQNTYFDDQCKEENNIWNQQTGYIEMKVATVKLLCLT